MLLPVGNGFNPLTTAKLDLRDACYHGRGGISLSENIMNDSSINMNTQADFAFTYRVVYFLTLLPSVEGLYKYPIQQTTFLERLCRKLSPVHHPTGYTRFCHNFCHGNTKVLGTSSLQRFEDSPHCPPPAQRVLFWAQSTAQPPPYCSGLP